MRRAYLLLTVVLLCAAALWFCSCTRGQDVKKPIRIVIIDWPGFYHIYLAEKMKFFAQEGVDARVALCNDNHEMVRKFETGEVDVIASVLSDCIQMHINGTPLKVVYVADYSDAADVIVAHPSIARLADLRGKRVSFERVNSFSHVFVLHTLEKHGLGETNVLFRNVPAMELLKYLDSGEVVAGHTWDPVTDKALTKGYRIIARAGDAPGIITDAIAFSMDLAENRRPAAQKIINALVKAQRYFTANQEESLGMISALVRRPVEELRISYGKVRHVPPEDNKRAFTDTGGYHSLHVSGKMILNFLAEHGRIIHPVALQEILDASFINSALEGKR